MKKFFTLFFSFALTISTIEAQVFAEDGEELLVKCHTYEMMDKLIEEHPELKPLIEQSALEQELHRKEFMKNKLQKDGETYIIPVVFHIVHAGGDENITPAQVQDAIRVMNQDFEAQTPGLAGVNPAFQDLISNTGIKFALAKRDPDGNCTNGIVRTYDQATFAGSDNLKFISPIWDRSMYLNVWVCETIESGSAGYSRYPSSVNGSFGATIDGIVIRSDYVGSIGTSNANRSHTMTHEAGHWLDLPHLWGSTNNPQEEGNCNTDDGVSDTPNTIGWTSCNTNGESCGSLDNVQNFMEYSYCSKMYTHGQADRMVAALNSSIAQRNQLWQESNLIATGVNLEATVCEAEFNASTRTICVGETVDFQDFSYSGITERQWNFEGGQPAISQDSAISVTYNTTGLFSVSLSAGDGTNTVLAVESDFIRVIDTASIALPFYEGFESLNTFDDSGVWYTENETGSQNWEISSEAAYSGSNSAVLDGLASNNGEKASFLSQSFDMSYFDSTNAALSFKYACKRRANSSNDKLRVFISRNCGEHWNLRRTLQGNELYTTLGFQSSPYVPSGQSEWNENIISNIVPLFFTSSFRVKFEFESDNGNYIYIDDINLNTASVLSDDILKEVKESVRIYPNPAVNSVNVEFTDLKGISNLELGVYDISGRLVEQVYSGGVSSANQKFTVNVDDMPSGLYFMRFSTPNGQFAKKFVVNK